MLSMPFTRLLGIFLVIFINLLLLIPSHVHAQQPQDLQLSPAILDISGQKGQKTNTAITLFNLSSSPLAVSAESQSLSPEDEPIDESVVDRYDASLWISLPIKDFLIEANGSVEVDVEVNIPENAVPGGHYALVVFNQVNSQELDSSGVRVNAKAGAVTLITVPGEIQEKVEIKTTKNRYFIFSGATDIEYEIMNTGNTHITPIIKTEIRDRNNNVVESITQPVQLLLPNTKRKIEVLWDKDKLGKFYASTTVSYGTPNQSIEAKNVNFVKIMSIQDMLVRFLIIYILINYTIKFGRKWIKNFSAKKKQKENNV